MEKTKGDHAREIGRIFYGLNKELLKSGFDTSQLETAYRETAPRKPPYHLILAIVIAAVAVFAIHEYRVVQIAFNYVLGVRCFVPNNYFVWEATRPVSDCAFCTNTTAAIILEDVTRESFAPYAYSSKPMVIKRAFVDWPAMRYFSFDFFKNLYDSVTDSHRSVDEECQFLHFKSNFISIEDVFSMSRARIENAPGEKSWYVGWGNCHPQILNELRRYYPKPHFLPEDCEIPSKDYVFMGYDDGATMHLDFINRLMWQAQLKGSKTWYLLPPPECEDVCSKLSFLVEPGDAVFVDTRVWYHGTRITPGEFSLSIQSEYG